jgi:hypothetical protein
MAFFKHDIVSVAPSPRAGLRRKISYEDRVKWQASPASKGMTSGGETKLQYPTTGRLPLEGETFTVLRGRARFADGWGRPTSGWTLVRDSDSQEWYIPTKCLLVVKS